MEEKTAHIFIREERRREKQRQTYIMGLREKNELTLQYFPKFILHFCFYLLYIVI